MVEFREISFVSCWRCVLSACSHAQKALTAPTMKCGPCLCLYHLGNFKPHLLFGDPIWSWFSYRLRDKMESQAFTCGNPVLLVPYFEEPVPFPNAHVWHLFFNIKKKHSGHWQDDSVVKELASKPDDLRLDPTPRSPRWKKRTDFFDFPICTMAFTHASISFDSKHMGTHTE